MKNQEVAVLDYGIGNVKSICNAFESIGAHPVLTADPEKIMKADALILPGVGAFTKGMSNLHNYKLIPVIKNFVASGKPFMGICLGMQMLMEQSEEFGTTDGLGLIKGKVIKMPLKDQSSEKLPHVSWNELKEPRQGRWRNTILNNISPGTDTYFVHSFVAVPEKAEQILATTNYGDVDFCAAVHHENVFGVQFHPEKSGETGHQMLKNFLDL